MTNLKTKRHAQLVRLAGQLAERSQQTTFALHTVLGALVHSSAWQGINPRDPDDTEVNEDGSESAFIGDDAVFDDLIAAVQGIISNVPDFNEQCRKILDDAEAAAQSGDKQGAAQAFQRYMDCLRRPRPVKLDG